uniref:Tyrosine-protein kinase receptor Tie-1-like n=1 Tax=Saccoglossus kowalevskii TaxID=10224 RepID=A0ABM0M6L9_SACKO|nr:PREDICTED: tyrosine-protein kinase receptor Tie-1-like [Saccoglossus kowalevskii]
MAMGNLWKFLKHSKKDGYPVYENIYGETKNLKHSDLIRFAYQVAMGMAYLEQKQCIHRDLAARNVLLDGEYNCKIADFGLARDVEVYHVTLQDRLPRKWMAIESLCRGVFTIKSDVWSFGVLLWEIATLGATPYAGNTSDEILIFLERGNRLRKPKHCEHALYALMRKCWCEDPSARPSFEKLSISICQMKATEKVYINLRELCKDAECIPVPVPHQDNNLQEYEQNGYQSIL